MRRLFLAAPVLMAVLAFGAMPASADMYAQADYHSGQRGQSYDARGTHDGWQGDRGYGQAREQWDNGSCARGGERRHGGERGFGERSFGGGRHMNRGGNGQWNRGGQQQWNRGGQQQWNRGDHGFDRDNDGDGR